MDIVFYFTLDTFHGLYRDQKARFDATQSAKLPMIHCHCFTRSPEPANDIIEVKTTHTHLSTIFFSYPHHLQSWEQKKIIIM